MENPAFYREQSNVAKPPMYPDVQPLAVDEDDNGDENKDRGNWSGTFDFILSCLGYAVGLGNVWRFPYLCYRNGGGAFFIPYLIMLFFVGLPLFYLELSVGQFTSLGPVGVFGKISPVLQGIGYAMVMISALVAIYYNVIIAWTLYYLFASFQRVLPWSGCNNGWNTDSCWSKSEEEECMKSNGTYYARQCYLNLTSAEANAYDQLSNNESSLRTSASEEYYKNKMLGLTTSINDYEGGLKWDLCLCLLLAWIIVCLCLIKGIKSSGKVVYFTATFPYVVLVILLIRGATLPGAAKGIRFYITPDLSVLSTPQVWVDAAGQIFFSLGVAFGGIMTLSSYNRFRNNCFRDSLVVALGNCATSVFAGFVIFSILGHMAYDLGKEVSEVASSGSGLAFVAYPTVLARLPVAPLWSILFFFMLLTLGLDSQFVFLETIFTTFMDGFPATRRYKPLIVSLIAVVLYLVALPMCTGAGLYWNDLMNTFAASWSVILVALGEGIAVAWVYGVRRFIGDITMMLGRNIAYKICNVYWIFTWLLTTPLLILGILVFNFIAYKTPTSQDIEYPKWAEVLGWVITWGTVALIPIVGAINFYRYSTDRIQTIFRPDPTWGPAMDRFRTGDYAPIGPAPSANIGGKAPLYTIADTAGYPGLYRPYPSDGYYTNPAFHSSQSSQL